MRRIQSNTYFHQRRDAFCGLFPKFDLQKTDYGFVLNGHQFAYKHAMENPAAPNNRVWQWRGLELLKEFARKYPTGRILLEAMTKPSDEHVRFIVPVDQLLLKIKGKKTFSIPADDGYHVSRPLADLIKRYRIDRLALEREFGKLSS